MKIIMIGYWVFHNSVHKEWKNSLRNIVFLTFTFVVVVITTQDGTRNVIKSNGANIQNNGILIYITKSSKHHIIFQKRLVAFEKPSLMFGNLLLEFVKNHSKFLHLWFFVFLWFAFLISVGRQTLYCSWIDCEILLWYLLCSIFDFCRKQNIENNIDQMLMLLMLNT